MDENNPYLDEPREVLDENQVYINELREELASLEERQAKNPSDYKAERIQRIQERISGR